MNSELRNWYLSTMGITQYIPKDSMPVAQSVSPANALVEGAVAESTVVESIEAKSAVSPSIEIADLESHSSSTEASVNSLPSRQRPKVMIDLGEDDRSQTSPAQEAPQTATELASADDEQQEQGMAVQFRLACWQPTDDLLVIEGLEPGFQPGAERVHLLSNILRAIKRLPDSGLEQAELIDWPLAQGGPSDEQGARTLLSVFLDARIKQRGVCWVLLMGEESYAYIGGEHSLTDSDEGSNTKADSSVGDQLELSGGAKAVIVNSLQSMLNDSSKKAETWQAIQFLVEA